MKINIVANSHEPIYYQIYKQIKKYIKNGEIKCGEQLPSERELSNSLGLSRVTIRKAIKDLISEGFCYKERGKGIFVSKERIPLKIDNLKGTANYFRLLGLNLETKMLFKKVIKPDIRLSEKLKTRSNVLYLKRLRIVEGERLIIDNAYLPLERMLNLEKYCFEGSLYKILYDIYKIQPNRSKSMITHKLADSDIVNLLDIPLNYMITERQSIVYDINNIPIEFVINYYRSDRFIFIYDSLFTKDENIAAFEKNLLPLWHYVPTS